MARHTRRARAGTRAGALTARRARLYDVVALPARCAVGATVATAGWQRLAAGVEPADTLAGGSGTVAGTVTAAVAYLAVCAGLALAVGLLTSVAGAGVVAVLAARLWPVPDGYRLPLDDAATPTVAVLALSALLLAVHGGRLSVDHALACRRTATTRNIDNKSGNPPAKRPDQAPPLPYS